MAIGICAGQVVAAARGPGDQRHGHQRHAGGDGGRESLRHRPECPQVGGDRQHRRRAHRAHAHRVDVVQVGALELDALRRQAQRLVDDQVGHHGHDPADGDVGVQAQHAADRAENLQLHQHQRDEGVEHHPHHAPGVAVRQPREEVAPGQAAGVGVGDVDLELADHHEQRGRRHRPAVVRKHQFVGRQVHLVGVHRAVGGHRQLQRQQGQQCAAQHLGHAQQHPPGSAHQHRAPPAAAVGGSLLGHETQVVHLLAHLGDERDAHRQRRAEEQRVELAASAIFTGVGAQIGQQRGVGVEDVDVGQHQQHQPQRLRPHLQLADGRHTMGDQRDDDQRADQVAPGGRDVERQLQRVGHDGRLEREEDEGEAGVDERGDGRADVAEAGAARQQVHVQPVARGVDADGPARQEDHPTRGHDGPEGVHEAELQQQRGAHGLQHQERCRAERGVGHAPFAPLAERARREAQRVVLHRFARHPGVVIAAHLDDALLRQFGAGGVDLGHGRAVRCRFRAKGQVAPGRPHRWARYGPG